MDKEKTRESKELREAAKSKYASGRAANRGVFIPETKFKGVNVERKRTKTEGIGQKV